MPLGCTLRSSAGCESLLRRTAGVKELEEIEYGRNAQDKDTVSFWAVVNGTVLSSFNKRFHPDEFEEKKKRNIYRIPQKKF